jgi:hypothetical protein
VFGVPTTQINEGEIFWGSESDTMAHVEDCIRGHDPVEPLVVDKWRKVVKGADRRSKVF